MLSVALAAALLLVIPSPGWAQSAKETRQQVPRKSPEVYGDREIEVKISKGWRILGTGNEEPRGRLLLEKDHYTLSLAYHTGQASGIIGGRFTEILRIPWPGLDDEWTCSGYLRQVSWPASRHLLFVNLIVDSGDAKVRENCGIQKALGTWIEKGGQKRFDFGDERWFGGYFTTESAGYFFGGDADGCGLKAYTLTSQATTPEQLPIADIPNQDNNPALEQIIQEAIDIVNSIHYKRCAPY